MKRHIPLGLFAILVVGLLGAAPAESLVRAANDAFAAGDYARAEELYAEAEVWTTDPGLVAYNKATTLYHRATEMENALERLKLFRAAEDHYRRCGTDPNTRRRGRALFGLGNSLVQARSDETAALAEAIRCYRECLRAPDADPALAEDARHNLELAKLLWIKAKARDEQRKKDDGDGGNNNPPNPPPPQGGHGRPEIGPEAGGGDPNSGDGHTPAELGPGQRPIQTSKTSPGSGNLPPIRDDDKLTPLTEQEAAEHLRRAMMRILEDRRGHLYRSARVPAGPVKDW